LNNLLTKLGEARKRFLKGNKRLYASSLAFKTVLAIVPILAILMSLLAADVFTQKREQLLDQIVDMIYPVNSSSSDPILTPAEKQNIQQLNQIGKQQIRNSIQRFANHSRRTGLIGLVLFFLVILFLMRDVERSFNFLWGIEKSRPLWRQTLRHTVLVVGAPALAILILNLSQWVGNNHLLRPLARQWIFSVALPFVILWMVCAWIYHWIPNAKVQRVAALSGGLAAAILLEIGRYAMTWYAVNVAGHSNIYGALWVFPIIMVWLYVSWVIILFGAEVSYVTQNAGKK